MIATMSADSTIKLWDSQALMRVDSSNISSSMLPDTPPESINVYKDHVRSCESTVKSTPIQQLIGHTQWVWDAAFSADSAYIVTASSDGTSKLWDVGSGEVVCTYVGHQKAVTAIAMNDLNDQ